MVESQLPQDARVSVHELQGGVGEFEPLTLGEVIDIYKRWHRLAIYAFAGLLLPAVVIIFLILPLYEAHGLVWVDRDSPNVYFTVQSDPESGATFRNVNREEEVATRAELFRSRIIVEKVVADLDLTLEKLNRIRDARRFVQIVIDGVVDGLRGIYNGIKYGLHLGTPLTPEQKAELEHIRLVDEVIDRINVVSLSESNVLRVSFRTSDPVLARDFVNRLIEEFIAFYGTIRVDRAEDYFAETTQRLHEELGAAEKEILSMQVQSNTFLSDEQKASLVLHYEQTKESLRNLKVREARLRAQVSSYRDHLSKSPDSVKIRQDLQENLMKAETELAALLEEKRSNTEVMNEYRSELDTIASINLQLQDQRRKAKLLEESYQLNMRNLEKARVGRAMSSASMSSVRVVSYAPYPIKTVRPRKLMYLTIAFVTSLLVGLAIPFLAHMNAVAVERRMLRHNLGLDRHDDNLNPQGNVLG